MGNWFSNWEDVVTPPIPEADPCEGLEGEELELCKREQAAASPEVPEVPDTAEASNNTADGPTVPDAIDSTEASNNAYKVPEVPEATEASNNASKVPETPISEATAAEVAHKAVTGGRRRRTRKKRAARNRTRKPESK